MKILFDISQMKVGCPLLQAAKGGDSSIPHCFDIKDWFIAPTPGMQLFEINDEQLRILRQKVGLKVPQPI